MSVNEIKQYDCRGLSNEVLIFSEQPKYQKFKINPILLSNIIVMIDIFHYHIHKVGISFQRPIFNGHNYSYKEIDYCYQQTFSHEKPSLITLGKGEEPIRANLHPSQAELVFFVWEVIFEYNFTVFDFPDLYTASAKV